MKISKHFHLEEYFKDKDLLKMGDSVAQWVLDRRVIDTMEYLRTTFDKRIIITSGYRSPERNKAVGGSTYSQHCLGKACDFLVDGMTSDEVREFIIREWKTNHMINHIRGLELGISWVHIDFRNSYELIKFKP